MSLFDISQLKGSSLLLKKNPHLTGAQIDKNFDKIIQHDDGSFGLRPIGKNFYINIEDGRKSVHTPNGKPYCTKQNKEGCVTWRGDLEAAPYFLPGPNRNEGNVEYVQWHHITRGPSIWMWVVIVFLIYQALT